MKKFIDHLVRVLADAVIKRIGLDGFHVAVLDIQPGDILVVKSDKEISEAGWERVKKQLQGLFPHNLVIAMEDTLDLSIVRAQEKAKNAR